MPLIKSGSREAVSTNIREMMASGYPQKQAVAAALSNARRYGRTYADGGAPRPSEDRMAAAWLPQDDRPLERYPTHEDVGFARQYGHFDIDPRSEYLNNQKFRLLAGNARPFLEGKNGGLPAADIRDPGEFTRRRMHDYYARAGLASKRSALAALGFDPSVTTVDTGAGFNVLGATRGDDRGEIYANIRNPSTLVHESIHRGVDRLKRTPFWRPEFKQYDADFDFDSNEHIPRYLMDKRVGQTSESNPPLRDRAVYHFEQSLGSKRNKKILDDMEMAASRYMASRNPRGPRARGGRAYAEGGEIPDRSISLEDVKNFARRFAHRNRLAPLVTTAGAAAPAIKGYSGGGYASGGTGSIMPWTERAAARGLQHAGFIKSPVPGRTDQLPIGVGGGAYVLPADHVAHVGQGNSIAGGQLLDNMFKLGTYGMKRGVKPRMPRLGMRRKQFAQGGEPGGDVDIVAAGGEYVIPPEVVAELGGGDMDQGHKILDKWVLSTRKHHINTLRGLKPPKKS